MAKRTPERKGRIFATEREPASEPASEPGTDDKPERLSFALDSDGRAAVEQLRPATREKLRRALSTPAAQAAIFGDGRKPSGPSPEDVAVCGALYDTLSSILVSIYRASGYSLEQAQLARYTDEQKAALVPLTAKVFNKWVGDFAYMDELMLGVALATITSQNIAAVQKVPASVVAMPRAVEASEPA